ncbi:hypothetical protein RFI_08428 [Reticulomyxa filosa]|uniref:Uncharacterized protein n=1 Tax=Reticulomyxa filosa TaxID=46433 RepID=X6NRQ0_RETFI|nr:hypothetical protein RFI_08428 [Reticulomyxa filosa]|eukprot:ETO28701.1 hypothetical protein RFI_08428 [Reticulomyxa filosa]
MLIGSSDYPNHMWCSWLGAFFTFCFLLSEAYFAGICWEILLTLTNPFRKPASDTYRIHVLSIGSVLVVTTLSRSLGAFEWRDDVQICYIKNTKASFNWFNLYLLYLPTLGTVILGIGVTVWAYYRLKTRILDATWELRWFVNSFLLQTTFMEVIRKQFVVVTSFTVCYLIGLFCWGPVVYVNYKDSDGRDTNTKWPSFLLLVYVTTQGLIDLIAWKLLDPTFDICSWRRAIAVSVSTIRKRDLGQPLIQKSTHQFSILLIHIHIYVYVVCMQACWSSTCMVNMFHHVFEQNLSKALRIEVISLMSEGIAQAIHRTALRTHKKNLRKQPAKPSQPATNAQKVKESDIVTMNSKPELFTSQPPLLDSLRNDSNDEDTSALLLSMSKGSVQNSIDFNGHDSEEYKSSNLAVVTPIDQPATLVPNQNNHALGIDANVPTHNDEQPKPHKRLDAKEDNPYTSYYLDNINAKPESRSLLFFFFFFYIYI